MVENPLEQLSLDELRERTSMKWTTHPSDVLPLWVAEMDVPTASPIVDALTATLERGDTGYPNGTAYADAFATFASSRWGWHDVIAERTLVVPDVMMGIVEVLRVLTRPGDPVVVNAPVYPPFYAFAEHADRTVVESLLDDQGRIDLADLERTFADLTSRCERVTYLLCNPHNPTGVVHTGESLSVVGILRACRVVMGHRG